MQSFRFVNCAKLYRILRHIIFNVIFFPFKNFLKSLWEIMNGKNTSGTNAAAEKVGGNIPSPL